MGNIRSKEASKGDKGDKGDTGLKVRIFKNFQITI